MTYARLQNEKEPVALDRSFAEFLKELPIRSIKPRTDLINFDLLP